MPEIDIKIDEGSAIAKLDGASEQVHESLLRALGPLAASLAAEAMGLAAAHIRFQGKKPGQYLASIYGGTSDKNGMVLGFVRSASPVAHLLEKGTPSRVDSGSKAGGPIFPAAGDVLAFEGDAGTVFARYVAPHSDPMDPYPAIAPAFDNNVGLIQSTIETAVLDALK